MNTTSNIMWIAINNWKKKDIMYSLYRTIIFDDFFPLFESFDNQYRYLEKNQKYSQFKTLIKRIENRN